MRIMLHFHLFLPWQAAAARRSAANRNWICAIFRSIFCAKSRVLGHKIFAPPSQYSIPGLCATADGSSVFFKKALRRPIFFDGEMKRRQFLSLLSYSSISFPPLFCHQIWIGGSVLRGEGKPEAITKNSLTDKKGEKLTQRFPTLSLATHGTTLFSFVILFANLFCRKRKTKTCFPSPPSSSSVGYELSKGSPPPPPSSSFGQ